MKGFAGQQFYIEQLQSFIYLTISKKQESMEEENYLILVVFVVLSDMMVG